jgi:hypothetical protein
VKSEAIRCAIKLHTEPALLARFADPFRRLPRGITELLRIVSSETLLRQISAKNNLNATLFKKVLLNYIQAVLLKGTHSDLRKLGLEQNSNKVQRKLHYKLLMNIFHPDKFNNEPSFHHYTQLILQAYKDVKYHQDSVISQTPNISRFSTEKHNGIQSTNWDAFVECRKKRRSIHLFMLPALGMFLVTFLLLFLLLIPSSPKITVKKYQDIDSSQDLSEKRYYFEDRNRNLSLSTR